ncbi:MAG: class I SAM-dependent methyltransferase [Planctomycetaceae bacterium]|jgi:tRNA (cmo5U34)-methyltransferase|nr:class I SAM-dependent methyltransferase [Planctomycetaceae bacterium]
MKSTTEEIRRRFDGDVNRFANLETGQVSIIDAKYLLDVVTESARRLVPGACDLLDIGCGAGNYTLAMLGRLPELNCTLVDLSESMLAKAFERISVRAAGKVTVIQGDLRKVELAENFFDIILASAVLHHLRDDDDWADVFKKLYKLLRSGGCLMIADLVIHENNSLNEFFWQHYADYLEKTGGQEFRQVILEYIAKEDTPRSITYQLELMKKTGFKNIEILHKNICFAAFGGIKE